MGFRFLFVEYPVFERFPTGKRKTFEHGALREAAGRAGPAAAFPHALVVVRDYLADDAEALLAGAWPDRIRIAPDEAGRAAALPAMLGA